MFHLRLKINTPKCICSLKGNFIRRVRDVPCMDYKYCTADFIHSQAEMVRPIYFVDTLVLLFQEKFAP